MKQEEMLYILIAIPTTISVIIILVTAYASFFESAKWLRDIIDKHEEKKLIRETYFFMFIPLINIIVLSSLLMVYLRSIVDKKSKWQFKNNKRDKEDEIKNLRSEKCF